MYSFAQLGVQLPHSSYAMWNYGAPVPSDQLQPGDLVFFDSLGHVGIYIGGGEYVDAPYTGAFVRVDSLSDPLGGRELLGRPPHHLGPSPKPRRIGLEHDRHVF